jgi:glycosyltransferase involved in cell wall biosynthesis
MRLRRFDPRSVKAVSRAHQRYGRALERQVSAEGMLRPALITADVFTAAFADLSWAESITYFAWDDWAVHPAQRRWRQAHAVAEERLRARKTRVVAVSQPIIDRLRPNGPALVVPNGVEEDEWTGPLAAVRWFEDLPRPRLLYTGTLDDRLEAHDLDEVARRFAHGSLVLLGPAVSTSHLGRVGRRSNVHLRPPVGRSELVAVVRAAEVGLLPHRRTPLTEAMSPLKLYEYLAGGRPVAATDLPAVRGVHPSVELVAAGDSFADAVERALSRGPMPEAERIAFIEANSWPRRIEAVLGAALGVVR